MKLQIFQHYDFQQLRFEVLLVEKIQAEVFWVVMPCSVVVLIPMFQRTQKTSTWNSNCHRFVGL